MHMARLLDPSRGPKSYSLASLTEYYNKGVSSFKHQLADRLLSDPGTTPEQAAQLQLFKKRLAASTKINMTKIFSRRRVLKNGALGKTFEMPSIVELHTSPQTIQKWVEYATLDAEATFFLREFLTVELKKFKVRFEDMNNLFDLYCKYWLPFGEILTELERNGIKVDLVHLADAEKRAFEDLHTLEKKFLEWLHAIRPEADQFNPSSVQQLQQLLYAPFKRIKVAKDDTSTQEHLDLTDFEGNRYEADTDDAAEGLGESDMAPTVKKPSSISLLSEFPEEREFKVENPTVASTHRGSPPTRQRQAAQAQDDEDQRPRHPAQVLLRLRPPLGRHPGALRPGRQARQGQVRLGLRTLQVDPPSAASSATPSSASRSASD